MAEEGKESRFVCKLCCRKFACGKSLGGHMRSHVAANSTENSAEFEGKVEFDMKRNQFVDESNGNGQSGYVLRENPKKTWRAVDARPPLQQEKVCKQCGKGFQSMKALCGHMACHSDKERERGAKYDHSWTSENQKMMMGFDSMSETEEAEEKTLRTTTRLSKSRECKRVAVKDDSSLPNLVVLGNNGSSSVSEIDGQEQEEIAKCLMMLSRDSLSKVGVNSVVESSDNNSVVMETTTKSCSIEMRREKRADHCVVNEVRKLGDGGSLEGENAKMEDSDSGYFLDECAKGESEVSVDWFRRNGGLSEWKRPQMSLKPVKSCGNELRKSSKGYAFDDDDCDGDDDDGMSSKCGGIESRKRKNVSEKQGFWNESHKKSKYECFNCRKAFKSYQALGGHRPCHKRSNAYGESGENSPDDAAAYYRSSAKFVESLSKRKEGAKNAPHSAEKKSRNKKNKVHVCPFCDRVFKNGQALGGHKRSHFLTGHDESSSHSLVEKPGLLDLNLPAPEADDDEGGGTFFSW